MLAIALVVRVNPGAAPASTTFDPANLCRVTRNSGAIVLLFAVVFILLAICMFLGVITPPFGLNVFVLKGLAPDVPIQGVFRGVMPFVDADIVKLALLAFFPALAPWLPSTMR